MKKEKTHKGKGDYFFEEDILSVLPLKRSYDSSFQMGNIILDLDKKGRINGVELLNASELFNLPKLFLKNIVGGELDIKVDKSLIKLKFKLKTHIRNADKLASLNIERVKPDFLTPTQLNLAVM